MRADTVSYAKHLSHKTTPQTQPLFGRKQVKNAAGGYTYKLSLEQRLDRFLILGCEGGSYYATEKAMTVENANMVLDCAKADPVGTVNRIVGISKSGRAPKNDPAIFALAIIASNAKLDDKLATAARLALEALNEVCRTGTHLFQFVEAVNEFRGWGRALRRAVSNWYLSKSPDRLAMQVTKYAQRNGWSHRDVLRLAHPKTNDRDVNEIFEYVTQREKWKAKAHGYSKENGGVLLLAVEEAKLAPAPKRVAQLIRDYGLVREHVPTEHLNDPEVWDALLTDMPATALLRNLNKMTQVGLLKPLSKATSFVVKQLTDVEFLKRGRLHPFNILVALKTYASGHGFRGSLTWQPTRQIVTALEEAFYLSFGTIEPTGKNWLFGIDVSGSMSEAINNTNVSCRSAAACMAMVGMRTEPNSYAFGFTSCFEDLGIHAGMSLGEVEKRVYNYNFGSTDCAIPMLHAAQHQLDVDVFVVLTDSETYAGRVHPSVALDKYRQEMGKDAKLIVVGMTATGNSIADPNDPRCLDVVGFDASAPVVMADFARD